MRTPPRLQLCLVELVAEGLPARPPGIFTEVSDEIPQIQYIDNVDMPIQKTIEVPQIQYIDKITDVPMIQNVQKSIDVPQLQYI